MVGADDTTHEARLLSIAHFFVPVPEPLGLVDGAEFNATSLEPLEVWIRRQDDAGQELDRQAQLEISLTFHHARTESVIPHRVRTLFDVAEKVFPSSSRPSARRDTPRLPAERTVVQIRVRVLGSVKEVSTDEDELTSAFDRGLEALRAVQRAYYAETKQSIHLAAREAMPPMVPLIVTDADESVVSAELSQFLVNAGVDSDIRHTQLTPQQAENIFVILEAEMQDRVFSTYPQWRRQAVTSFDRDGHYEATVLFAAVAAENFLNEVLGHLLWEELETPENAAAVFDTSLIARVKSQYHNRIGGRWSADADSPPTAWRKNTAALRNRVLHAGYSPSRSEADAALDGLLDLETFVADLLAKPRALSNYPRTAIALLGSPGLECRGALSRRIDELTLDRKEVPWVETFSRWRAAMRRETVEGAEILQRPSLATSRTVVALLPNGEVHEYAHDFGAGYAAEIEHVPPSSGDLRLLLDQHRQAFADNEVTEAISVVLLDQRPFVPKPLWVPEYRVIPGHGTMRDGSDLDR